MPDRKVQLTWRDSRKGTVRASEEETILEAAEAADVDLPFGCRTGACGSCVGRLLDGDVAHERPPRALHSHRVRAGYVLCCIARPQSDCRVEVGAAVGAQLRSNPWR